MKGKWICCPKCGPGIKIFWLIEGTIIVGGGAINKCRRCKQKILITEDGKAQITA